MSRVIDKHDYLILVRKLSQSGSSVGDLILKESDMADIINKYASDHNIKLVIGSNKNAVYIKDGYLMMDVMIRKKREEFNLPHSVGTRSVLAVVGGGF